MTFGGKRACGFCASATSAVKSAQTVRAAAVALRVIGPAASDSAVPQFNNDCPISAVRRWASLSDVREFSRRVPPFQRLRLAVLHDELIDNIRELRDAELQALVGHELALGLADEDEEEASVLLQDDLEPGPGGSLVRSRELLENARVERIGPARKGGLGLVQGHEGPVHVALRVGAEIDRPLSVTLVVGRVEAVVVIVGHGKSHLVEIELELAVLLRDLEQPVGGVLVLAHIVLERVRGLRVLDLVRAGLRPRLRLGLLPFSRISSHRFVHGVWSIPSIRSYTL